MIVIHLGTLPCSLLLQNASLKIACCPMDPEEKWATRTSLGFVKERLVSLGRRRVLGELGCRCEQGVEWGWDWRPGLYITQRRWNQLGRLSFFLFLTEETFYLVRWVVYLELLGKLRSRGLASTALHPFVKGLDPPAEARRQNWERGLGEPTTYQFNLRPGQPMAFQVASDIKGIMGNHCQNQSPVLVCASAAMGYVMGLGFGGHTISSHHWVLGCCPALCQTGPEPLSLTSMVESSRVILSVPLHSVLWFFFFKWEFCHSGILIGS